MNLEQFLASTKKRRCCDLLQGLTTTYGEGFALLNLEGQHRMNDAADAAIELLEKAWEKSVLETAGTLDPKRKAGGYHADL